MAFGENTPMARRRLLQDEPPATEAVPFAAAVPASAVALGAIPEDNEPPTTPSSADDAICDLQDRLDASTSAQCNMQEQLLRQQQVMNQMAAAQAEMAAAQALRRQQMNCSRMQLTAAVASSAAA
jgi:hypothetical protein